MTAEQVAAFLAQAMPGQPGLDAGAVGVPERLLLPEPQVDEARTARSGGVAFVPPALLHVRSDALAAAGLTAGFDEDTRTLVLTAPAELAFAIVDAAGPRASGLATGTRVEIATDRASTFGVWSEAGLLAVGAIDARAIELRVVHAWPAPVAIPDDARGTGSRWEQTVALGRIARAMGPTADREATIAARRWPRSLTAEQRALLERFATVEAHGIAARLARLQDGFGLGTSLDLAWQAVCWSRDDLEGIRVLLREAGGVQALATALRAVDDAGRAVRFSWPSDVDVHDERLQRIAEADPGAWWGSTRCQVVWL